MKEGTTFWVDRDWIQEFKKNADIISSIELDWTACIQESRPGIYELKAEMSQALAFFGWCVEEIDQDDYDGRLGSDHLEAQYTLVPKNNTESPSLAAKIFFEYKANIPGAKDKFDLLRDLEKTIMELKEHLRSINDPTILTATVHHALSYMVALNEFIGTRDIEPPDVAPVGLGKTTISRITSVNWIGISETAAALAQRIKTIIESLRLFF